MTTRRLSGVAGALLAVAGLAAVRGAVARRGPDYAGLLLPLDHLFDVLLAAGILLLGTGLGRHVLLRARLDLEDPLDALAFSTAIGLGVLSTLLLGLGVMGGLGGGPLSVLLAGAALVARREIQGLPALLARIPGSMRASDANVRGLRAAWVVFGLVGAFLLCFGVAPPTDWDALMYHLEVPSAFLQAGRIYLPEDNLHATLAGVLHLLYVPLLAAGSEAGPTLLNVLLTMLLGLTVFRVGSRLFGGDTGTLALILFWGTTTVLLVAITPRTDVALAFFLFLGHYAILRAFEATSPGALSGGPGRSVEAEDPVGPVQWVALGAVVLGFGVAAKFNGLAHAVVLVPLALWVLGRSGAGRAGGPRALLLWGGLGTLVMAPWLLKNLILVGAPFYPFLANRIAEPWLDPLFPGGSAAEAVGPHTLRFLRAVQAPFDLTSLFFAPSALNVEQEGAFYFMNRSLLILPLWAVLSRRRLPALLMAPALAYAVLALVLDVPNVRYLVPAVPALTVAVAWVVTEVARRWLKGWAGAGWIAAVCAFALLPTAGTMRVWLRTVPAPEHMVGSVSANEYLRRHPAFGSFAPVVEYVNRDLPADARLLMLFEARGFPIHRDVLQDNKISNWPILAAAREVGTDPCLRGAGFDFVLLATGTLGYYGRRGLDPEALRIPHFEEFRRGCLDAVWASPGYELFRLRPADRSVAIVLVGATVTAAVPAWRATRVDPREALEDR